MKRTLLVLALALSACTANSPKSDPTHHPKESSVDAVKIYSFTMKDIDGHDKKLADYKGKVLLVVNVASKCGNTPQYKGLEEFYKKHKSEGFEILGFPANNFGSQEPGSESDIKQFCSSNYGVSFPMFSKISVKGGDIHPLYQYLTTATDFKGEVGWNFGKFLVNRDGKVVGRFDPSAKVETPEVSGAILAALR